MKRTRSQGIFDDHIRSVFRLTELEEPPALALAQLYAEVEELLWNHAVAWLSDFREAAGHDPHGLPAQAEDVVGRLDASAFLHALCGVVQDLYRARVLERV